MKLSGQPFHQFFSNFYSLQAYSSHLECITEDQKYGGANYKAPEMKGKNKQNQWIQVIDQLFLVGRFFNDNSFFEQNIKDLIAENSYPKDVQYILQSLISYDNIPRKKAKFINFIKNSFRIRDELLITKVWDVFENSIKAKQVDAKQNNGNAGDQDDLSNSGIKRKDSPENDNSTNNVKKAKSEASDNDVPTQQLKLKKVVEDFIAEKGSIKIDKLKKKVLHLYNQNGYDNDLEILSKFEKIIKKKKFILNDNLISLNE